MRISATLFLTSLLFMGSPCLIAQNARIPVEWLQFHTDFEKQGFTALEKGDTNWVHLLLSTSPNIDSSQYFNYSAQLDKVLFKLNGDELVRKSPKKIIKTIFNTVHDELLIRYNEKNYFHELFESGRYNCVSATSIYSYMLGQLGLRHALIELPTHVLAVALIEDEQWVLESTDPQQGFYEISNKDHDDFIEMLLRQKMITTDELNSEKRDSLLSFYSKSQAITPARLVAIQYYNQMIYALEEERMEEAFHYGLKSLYFDNSSPLPGIDMVIWEWLDGENYNNAAFFPVFHYAWTSLSTEKQLEHAATIDYFGEQLSQGMMTDSIFSIWADFYSTAYPENDSTQRFVNARSWVHRGIYALNQGKILNGLSSSKKAMNYNELDQTARSLLLVCLGQTVRNGLIKEEAIIDSVMAINEQYQSLINFPLWRNLIADIYIGKALYHCDRKEFTLAIKYLDSMEELLNGEMPETIPRERVSRAYSKVAHHAYQSNKKHALLWIERGLVYLPEDDLLNNLRDYYSEH